MWANNKLSNLNGKYKYISKLSNLKLTYQIFLFLLVHSQDLCMHPKSLDLKQQLSQNDE